MEIERVNVLGVGVSVLDQERARRYLFDAARNGTRGYVTVTNIHGVGEVQDDPALMEIFGRAMLVTPDGMPMVWMGKLQGFSSIQRVYGPDLMLNLCAGSVEAGFSHFFYGGAPGVAQQLQRNFEKRFPGIRIVGTYTPPFRELNPDEVAELQRLVAEMKPDFFWVGLSTPKQERFMAKYLPLLPDAKIFVGVGAAFDFFTGRVKQAPRWMMKAGLEWFYRLCQEPRRLFKRYAIFIPLFVFRATKQLLQRPKRPG